MCIYVYIYLLVNYVPFLLAHSITYVLLTTRLHFNSNLLIVVGGKSWLMSGSMLQKLLQVWIVHQCSIQLKIYKCFGLSDFGHIFVGSEGTPDSANPSYIDDDEEEGLPSPPLDEGAFFATQPTSMELSQVWLLLFL